MHDDRFHWEADKPCEGFTITFKKGREQEFARIYINIKMSKSVEKLKFSMSIQNLQGGYMKQKCNCFSWGITPEISWLAYSFYSVYT